MVGANRADVALRGRSYDLCNVAGFLATDLPPSPIVCARQWPNSGQCFLLLAFSTRVAISDEQPKANLDNNHRWPRTAWAALLAVRELQEFVAAVLSAAPVGQSRDFLARSRLNWGLPVGR